MLALTLILAGLQSPQASAIKVVPLLGMEARSPNPKAGGVFRIACRIDVDEHGVDIPRFIIHAPLPEHAAFARKAGRFLGTIWRLADRRFGTLCARLREKPVELWLALDGEAGGEQINNHLYVYDFLASRTNLELARELAHEYGHYLLPSSSGYSSPENWANGVLGERLFLKWLRDSGEESEIVARKDLQEYCEYQPDPLIDRYLQASPDRALLAATDQKAFDAFTGLMLYADAVYGGTAIMQTLSYIPRSASGIVRGTDFLAGLTAWLNDAPAIRVLLVASPMYLYLPKGRFRLGDVPPKLKLPAGIKIERTGAASILSSSGSGWIRVSIDGPAPRTMKLERLP